MRRVQITDENMKFISELASEYEVSISFILNAIIEGYIKKMMEHKCDCCNCEMKNECNDINDQISNNNDVVGMIINLN